MKEYKKLEKHFEGLSHLTTIQGLLNWDKNVLTGKKALPCRSEQMSELSSVIHERLTDKRLENLFEKAFEEKDLKVWQKRNLEVMYDIFQKANLLDDDFVRKFSLASSHSHNVWIDAKKNNDWKSFSHALEKTVEYVKKKADLKAELKNTTRYNACIDSFEEGETVEHIDKLFLELKEFLMPKVSAFPEARPNHKDIYFEPLQQERLFKEVMSYLMFDFEKGRLDEAIHPFCSAYKREARITTFYKEHDLFQGLLATVHETGHASYQLGLPEAWTGQPVGNSLGMSVHESQSLLFEMQVGRSKEFLSFMLKLIKKHFSETEKWSLEDVCKKVLKVERGCSRVQSDEMTYPLHVILRYEIEKELIEDKIKVSDIPELWNMKMEEYFGLSTKGRDDLGCLQDPHWSYGAFGYFPMYTLGALSAAQFFFKASDKIESLKEDFSKGNFEALLVWLEENVWKWGCFYKASELINKVTNSPLKVEAFKRHIERRYLY